MVSSPVVSTTLIHSITVPLPRSLIPGIVFVIGSDLGWSVISQVSRLPEISIFQSLEERFTIAFEDQGTAVHEVPNHRVRLEVDFSGARVCRPSRAGGAK